MIEFQLTNKNYIGNQVLELIDFCNKSDIKYDKIFQEIASCIDFNIHVCILCFRYIIIYI